MNKNQHLYKIVFPIDLKIGDQIIYNGTLVKIEIIGKGKGASSFLFGEYWFVHTNKGKFWLYENLPVVKLK